MTRANNRSPPSGKSELGDGRGWHDVAWAFLKPFPSPGVSNAEAKLRLQLYRPHQRRMPPPIQSGPGAAPPEAESEARVVWNWWINCKHVKYPSSLYVTVQAIPPPKRDGSGAGGGKRGVIGAGEDGGGGGGGEDTQETQDAVERYNF